MEIYEDLFNPAFLNNTPEQTAFPKETSLTMAYIPLQLSLDAYSSDKALENGTLFPELNKPFKGRMVKK